MGNGRQAAVPVLPWVGGWKCPTTPNVSVGGPRAYLRVTTVTGEPELLDRVPLGEGLALLPVVRQRLHITWYIISAAVRQISRGASETTFGMITDRLNDGGSVKVDSIHTYMYVYATHTLNYR